MMVSLEIAQLPVSGAEKRSTVARVKACYVACLQQVCFLPEIVVHAEGSCRLRFAVRPLFCAKSSRKTGVASRDLDFFPFGIDTSFGDS